MTSTENSQRFFYIKQLLCFNQVGRLNRVIELDGLQLSEASIHDELLSELRDLKQNFVIPTLTIKTNNSVVNFLKASDRIREALDSIPTYSVPIENAVNNTPNLPGLSKEYLEMFQSDGVVHDIRHSLMTIIDISDMMFYRLFAYVKNTEWQLMFPHAISYVNLLAVIEFLFSLSEMGEAGFNIGNSGGDNPWVD